MSTERAVPRRVRRSKTPLHRFSVRFFFATLAFVFVAVGIHAGLLILMQSRQWAPIIVTHVIVFYWIAVAAGMTEIARTQIQRTYERPMKLISETAEKVARGDFTVSIPYAHKSEEEYDLFDSMIHDINAMIGELHSIETLKTDFVSNVSHEMKTPLAVIRSYADLLDSPGLTHQEHREYTNAIRDAAGKMTELITNILRLNRMENQRITPQLCSYDVSRQLSDCLLAFEHQWEKREIAPEFDLEDRAVVYGDEEMLVMVWNNLMSNALKFTESGGSVTVRQWTQGERVCISFADTGCGISEETKGHIFDKFYQGDTSHATEGNGLGLALVKRVLDMMDGEITVESVPGQGSTFTVSLRRGTSCRTAIPEQQ